MISLNNGMATLRRGGCVLVSLASLMLLEGCGGSNSSPSTSSSSPGSGSVNNVQSVVVNAGPTNNLVDTLFTSVTICVPGTSNCQTIPNVQVDTGSVGLRILSSQLTLSLTPAQDGSGNPLGNCVAFADNSYAWGSVATADVQIAGEKASSVPIQVIGASSLPAAPSACNTGGLADDTVSALGANGLLGIGVFRQDCGSACGPGVASAPAFYFSCPNSGCSVTTVALQNQLQNPVWLFPQDNNGVLISLPSVPANGMATVSGSLIFGIGTHSNNALGSAGVYTLDDVGDFSTTFAGQTYSGSFLDTGSNGIFFLDPTTLGIPNCRDGNSGFYCPSSTMNYSATNTGTNGTSGSVPFSIANADSLFNTNNTAFGDLGGENPGSFDWGLPFYFGRNVFSAIENQNTPAGAGPYWAY
jgi:hypothetical protein